MRWFRNARSLYRHIHGLQSYSLDGRRIKLQACEECSNRGLGWFVAYAWETRHAR